MRTEEGGKKEEWNEEERKIKRLEEKEKTVTAKKNETEV